MAAETDAMTESSRSRNLIKAGADYAVALCLCLVILVITLKLWRADFHVPFSCQGDGLFTQLWIKGIIENGWYLHQDRVGIPGGSDMHDFPMADNFHFGVLKLLSLFSSDTAVVYNCFCLLSFPLVLISSLAVLRHLRFPGHIATVLALLYTFLPYHFLRSLRGHVFLMSYFMIPPAVLVVLWICGAQLDQRPQLATTPARSASEALAGASDWCSSLARSHSRFTRWQWLIVVLICIGISSTGIYYAFFGCFLFAVAGLICLGQRNPRGSVVSLVLIGTIVVGVLANLLPNILYRQTHGVNPNAVLRALASPEVFGMKITQLVLPMSMHRVGWLASEKALYNAALPLGCADFGYLGAFGVLGFVGLLGRMLFKRPKARAGGILDVLQVLNLCAVLLATVGGLGMVGSLFVGPWLRCFERMSVVIAFLSLLAVGVAYSQTIERRSRLSQSRFLLPAILACVLVAGIWEETSSHFVPRYAALSKEYTQDASFISQIEANVPEGAAIFQLPYVPFPENGRLNRMSDYDHLRAYLHSRTLRWSYGAIKGRHGDGWQRTIAKLPADEMVHALQSAGFEGIYLDRYGYEDNGARIEKKLTRLLGQPLLVSPNKRWCFFKLSRYEPPADIATAFRNPN